MKPYILTCPNCGFAHILCSYTNLDVNGDEMQVKCPGCRIELRARCKEVTYTLEPLMAYHVCPGCNAEIRFAPPEIPIHKQIIMKCVCGYESNIPRLRHLPLTPGLKRELQSQLCPFYFDCRRTDLISEVSMRNSEGKYRELWENGELVWSFSESEIELPS